MKNIYLFFKHTLSEKDEIQQKCEQNKIKIYIYKKKKATMMYSCIFYSVQLNCISIAAQLTQGALYTVS